MTNRFTNIPPAIVISVSRIAVFLACIVALSDFAIPARGAEVVIYDNGGPDQDNGFELTHWIEAGQFTISASSIFTDITFWDAEASSAFTGSIVWQICANSPNNTPGAILFSGTSTSLSHSATGLKVFGIYPEYLNTFTLPSISLPLGTYWITMHNGPLSNNTGEDVFWETTTNSSTAPSLSDVSPFSGNWQSNASLSDPNSQLAFRFGGVPAAWAARVTSVTVVSGSAKITFSTATGQTYRVDYKNSLPDASWTPLPNGTNIAGNGGLVTVIDTGVVQTGTMHRFYRVVLQ